MRQTSLLMFMLCMFFSISPASAQTATDTLQQFFSDFSQTVQNSQLSSMERASGKLWIQRPGKFRWNYQNPYMQEIVSDGNKIWIYDADLEQVTVKQVNATLGQTPALLLSGTKPLNETFKIMEIGKMENLNWVELTPKDPDAGFTGIRLGFNGKTLEEMLMQDNLGQITRLTFKNLILNSKLDPALFNFVAPAGADVFESSE